MAEVQEDIIIIEDSEAAGFDDGSANNTKPKKEGLSQKKLIIISAVLLVVLIGVVVAALFAFKASKEQEVISINTIEKKLDKNTSKPIEPSKLEKMIAKANYLYTNGSKEEALYLYEKIAIYSEAISQYNLGVAQLKGKQYALALQTFQKAIQNDEKRCVSAINAAVCSLHLDDKESFKYYIDLAYAYLPNEINSPLYSYYYTLINYYNQNYLEALSALKNPTSKEYPSTQKHLSAKINALFCNNYDAIENLEENYSHQDTFSLGLLYARVGDLSLARSHLEDAILREIEPVKATLALAFVNLQAGRITSAGKDIQNITDMFEEEVYKPYPIKVKLKDSLFDPDKAQYRYKNVTQHTKKVIYQKLFYFSPYKVFNADQTISYIRKGTANIYIDNVQGAQEYLKKSSSSSSVNQGIAKSIKKALAFKIREANQELQSLVKIQPKHSILHYDLALTYAQLGDMLNAHKHFLRSYHLDAKNYLSGIFALMSGELINKNSIKLRSIIKESVLDEEESQEKEFYKTLLFMSEGNYLSAVEWLDHNYKQRPIYLAMEILIALQLNKQDTAKKAAKKLTLLQANDILPHLMYIDAYFNDLKTKEYAKKVQNYLKKQHFHFQDLYYGAYITRYLYIQQNLITGKLYFLKKQLTDVLQTTKENPEELTSALALTCLYGKDFEESYTLFNQLIDDLKVRDAYTLFLGAVASTAAQHHANAIALLELSKMKDTNFVESRYALGLLYLEDKNNQGAAIQLKRVGDNGFNSEFFDFEINTDLLLFQKQHNEK